MQYKGYWIKHGCQQLGLSWNYFLVIQNLYYNVFIVSAHVHWLKYVFIYLSVKMYLYQPIHEIY